MKKYFHDKTQKNTLTIGMGNSKLDKSIMIFNLPAGITCPNGSQCFNTCYAMKSQRLYPSVLKSRMNNFMASKQRDFTNRMIDLISFTSKKTGSLVMRVHESGDFYNKQYSDLWQKIIESLPHIQFYGYTKSQFFPVASNFNLVKSTLPDGGINYGNLDYCMEKIIKFGGCICPETLGQKVKCGLDCKLCHTTKNPVYFIKH